MTQSRKKNQRLRQLLLVCFVFFGCMLLAELILRISDKQPVLGALPYLYSKHDPHIKNKVEWLSMEIARERNVPDSIKQLFYEDPLPRLFGEKRPEVEKAAAAYTLRDSERAASVMKAWNRNFLNSIYCNADERVYTRIMLRGYGVVNSFEPFDNSIHPVYRYMPNSFYEEGKNKLRFNEFGWGGDWVTLEKPQQVIRLAFLGASTTQQISKCDFAYPDYIGRWLNAWAEKKKINARFEVINAGRIALKSPDIRAIMRYELMPAAPDIFVYYEGANQFFAKDLVCHCENDNVFAYDLLRKSALFRRVIYVGNFNFFERIENAKPSDNFQFPRRVSISEPDISSPVLPLDLPQILEDLDSIRTDAQRINATLAVCSYAMFTGDDALLKSGMKYASVYSYWMLSFGAMRLKDLEMLSHFQNRVIEKWCTARQTPFIDVAAALPRLPEAFVDGIHLNCEGMKFHAWVVFLDLLPLIDEKIRTGELPRQSSASYKKHPFLQDEFVTVPLPYPCDTHK